MLDFYLTKDETPKSMQGAADQDYLGGIDYNEFEQLQEIRIIEKYLDYYKDFRWTSDQVEAKLRLLSGTSNSKNYSLLPILQKAKDANCGIVAYSD